MKATSLERHLLENPLRPKGTTIPKDGTKFVGAHFPGRSGLEAYIAAPQSFPASRVVYHNDDWVVIKDLYPKSSVHLLLLPRDLKLSHMHPYDALADPEIAAQMQAEATYVASIAAAELRRLFGADSKAESGRNAAMLQGNKHDKVRHVPVLTKTL